MQCKACTGNKKPLNTPPAMFKGTTNYKVAGR